MTSNLSKYTFIIGILLSLCIHFVMLSGFANLGVRSKSTNIHYNLTAHLTIDISSHNSSKQKKYQPGNNSLLPNKEKVVSNQPNIKKQQIFRGTSIEQKANAEVKILPVSKIQRHPTKNKSIIKPVKRPIKEQIKNNRINYNQIHDQTIQFEQTWEAEDNSKREGFTVFSKNLRSKLTALKKEKEKNKQLTKSQQFNKENEYFEYNSIGESKIVRINSNCFEVPQDNPFELIPTTWSLIGNCAKQKEFTFKAKTLVRENQERNVRLNRNKLK
ncbi:hypothetical protein H0A36_22130 [Endozoicomonas sp. SM1973]|uniref:Uncharacterized protein n=1 Tax=Spartinivicinus marinus TaxID=2994442 RepID=A0A853I7D5_9GAMM|nr:hypothetical protein [Spartinivicinus marinus]MCX4026187.1 hypothetical protein [Spartinivicinus marinus]NYZ68719.1 hypothetical protein [Spartinivicinus marinus]